MKLIAAENLTAESAIETVLVSREQFEFLKRFAEQLNPDMPMAFGGAHAIRTLLERFEDADIDLTGASSEEEIPAAAAQELRQRKPARRRVTG